MSENLVSVCLITYNHEKYITDAIESVLMQKTDFVFELVIADDYSTDGNREILLKYKRNYPNKIKLILQDTNVGAARNWLDLLSYPKSKYIAYFEGDDYWTDPLKLQKQVDFLEANPDYVMCFHEVNIVMPDGELKDDFITKVPNSSLLNQRLLIENNNFIHTPSIMFRNLGIDVPLEIMYSPVGDYLIYLWLTNYGDIGYIRERMGIYRFGTGIHSIKTQEKKNKEWYWVLLVGSFLIENQNNKELIENKLINHLKLFSNWAELIYDYKFIEGVKKHLDICKKTYIESQRFNIRKMSVNVILTYLMKIIYNRFKLI